MFSFAEIRILCDCVYICELKKKIVFSLAKFSIAFYFFFILSDNIFSYIEFASASLVLYICILILVIIIYICVG